MRIEELMISKDSAHVFKLKKLHEKPGIYPHIVPGTIPWPPLKGDIIKEQRWLANHVLKTNCRYQLPFMDEIGLKPHNPHDTAAFLSTTLTANSSFCLNWQGFNHNGKPTVNHQVIARNVPDAELIRTGFQAVYRGETDKPVSVENDVLYKTVKLIKNDELLRKEYVYRHFDFISNNNIYDSLQIPVISDTSHPLKPFYEMTKLLEGHEIISIQLILFPSSTKYYDDFSILKDLDTANEISRTEINTLGTVKPYYKKQKEDTDRKLAERVPLMCFCLRVIGIFRKDRENILSSQARSLYKNQPFRIETLEHYAKARVSLKTVIDADIIGASLRQYQLISIQEAAGLLPAPNSNMLVESNVSTYVLMGDPIPDLSLSSRKTISLGIDPQSNKSLEIDESKGVPGFNLVGASGTGKTSMMTILARENFDVLECGGCLIYPNAPLPQALPAVPEKILHEKPEDIIVIDPYALRPVGIKLLTSDPEARESVIDSLILVEMTHATRHREQGVSWGHNVKQGSYNSMRCLTASPFENATLADVQYMNQNESFRNRVVQMTEDTKAQDYFRYEYADLKQKGRDPSTSVATILSDFVEKPVGNVLCQRNPKLDIFEEVKKGGKIFILDLHRNRMGMSRSWGFATLFLNILICAVMNCDRYLDDKFVFVLDEAGLYMTKLCERALNNARNYGGRWIIASQNRFQFIEEVMNGVLALPIQIAYRTFADEASYFMKELHLNPKRLTDMAPYHYYLRIRDKVHFLTSRKPLPPVSDEIVNKVRRLTEEQYGGEAPVYDEKYYEEIFPDKGKRKRV